MRKSKGANLATTTKDDPFAYSLPLKSAISNYIAALRPLAYCPECNLRVVLAPDGSIPRHWPNGWRLGDVGCVGAGTRALEAA